MSASAPNEEEVFRRLQEVPASNDRIEVSDMDQFSNTTGELSKVLEYKADRPLFVREDVAVDLHIVVHEQFTTDGTAGNTETFNLARDLIDGPVQDDFLLYEGANEKSPDSVDYANDSFDYTDDGTSNTLHAYYLASTQAAVQVRKTAPKKFYEIIDERDAGLANLRDQNRDPLTFSYDDPVTGLVPESWNIQIYIDAPFTVQFDDSTDSGATADNMLVSIPIRRSRKSVKGLEDLVVSRIGSGG